MKSFFSNKIVIALIASFSVATVLFCIAPIGLVYDVVFYFAAFAAIFSFTYLCYDLGLAKYNAWKYFITTTRTLRYL